MLSEKKKKNKIGAQEAHVTPARNGVANVIAFKKIVYFRDLFSSILSIRICDRSAQFLVNCFENIVMQQTIADFIQLICF